MHIAIIGGGFAGAACALHLLRDHPGLPAALTIVEPRAVLGAGLAYSTPAPEHRTNVPAARMSVLPDDPDHFHRWLENRGEPSRDAAAAMPDGRLFAARALFGSYVDATLRAHVAAHPNVAFRHLRMLAQAVVPTAGGFDVLVDGGPTFHADAVVLAISHSAPDLPGPLRGCPGVIADPWNTAALTAIAPKARVLVVGTGLTACDVVASLLAHAHRGPIMAISRHGLLPRPRTTLPVQAEGEFSNRPEVTASRLLRRVRRAIRVAAEGGRPWENIIDALRQQAGAVWGALDWTERRRMLRHLRTVWDVHRFQSAPQIDAALADAQMTGQLQVCAARLLRAQPTKLGSLVSLQPRGAGCLTAMVEVAAIINCTGPGHRSVTQSHPVLRALAAAGELMADPAHLGIWVDGHSRVLRADGTAWRNLFVAGPLARGTFGELMGLPQVNLQPRAVAAELAQCAAAALA